MQHTKEPWGVKELYDGYALFKDEKLSNGIMFIAKEICQGRDGGKADAFRIKNVINAMAGIDDPIKFVKDAKNAAVKIESLEKEKSELLAVLKRWQNEWVVNGNPQQQSNNYSIEIAIDQVIKKHSNKT